MLNPDRLPSSSKPARKPAQKLSVAVQPGPMESIPGDDASVANAAASCWLLDGAGAGRHSCAARFARLRGIIFRECADVESIPAEVRGPTMVAVSAAHLHAIPAPGKRHLANLVAQGASLYVRGVPPAGAALDLAPFVQSHVIIDPETRATRYRFSASRMLPAAIAREKAAGDFRAHGAHDLPGQAEELLMVRHADGTERPAIFALRHGNGYVIYDLHEEEDDCFEVPLVDRLANPQSRHQDIGAMVAADSAIGRDVLRLPPFDLMIDDRPINLDYFGVKAMRELLLHLEGVCPNMHIDFGWTPRYSSPSRRYIEVMKRFSTGFVWHGLYRHVDHRTIADPRAEFARGIRLAADIQHRLGIRLQPIMIFPFEKAATNQFRLLVQAGFLACVQQPPKMRSFDTHLTSYLERSLPSVSDPFSGFTILYRHSVDTLTADRMLAMATLGLPIIAYGHPEDVGMHRFSRLRPARGDVTHFDPVLRFASSKELPARSLEEIAGEVKAQSEAHGG
jgi:hypothetical protein